VVKQVSFYGNTADDTRCVEAVLKMVLKYFLPKQGFSWQRLDKLSRKAQARAHCCSQPSPTWTKPGLKVRYIEQFNYGRCWQQGQSDLIDFYGNEIARWFVDNSNLVAAGHLIPKTYKNGGP